MIYECMFVYILYGRRRKQHAKDVYKVSQFTLLVNKVSTRIHNVYFVHNNYAMLQILYFAVYYTKHM